MKISTRGRYALRLMVELALNQDGDPVRIKDVAERQEISAKYLEQIVSVLVKARFVRSIRGPQGGYRLTRKPEEYCVGDIIRLIEGDMSPVSCLEDTENRCPRQASCVTLRIWKKPSAVYWISTRWQIWYSGRRNCHRIMLSDRRRDKCIHFLSILREI